MPSDRSEEYRRLASQCLDLARAITDQAERARLVMMATQFFELSKVPAADLNNVLEDFNHEMITRPVYSSKRNNNSNGRRLNPIRSRTESFVRRSFFFCGRSNYPRRVHVAIDGDATSQKGNSATRRAQSTRRTAAGGI
jgi:hypothetical protein